MSELVHSFPDAAGMVARSLKTAIQSYEPRLTNVRVRHVTSEDMVLRFEISGQLAGAGRVPMQFQTTIDTTRRLSVR